MRPRPELTQVLRSERVRQGLWQVELAQRLGVHQSTLSQWETNTVVPSVPYLAQWCEALGMRLAVIPNQGEGGVG